MTFSVHLGSSAHLEITFVEKTGKPVLKYGVRAVKGRNTFSTQLPSIDLKKGSKLTLKVSLVADGKTHTASIPVKI